MSSSRQVRSEKRFYVPPPMRKLQQEVEKKKSSSEDLLLTKSSKSVREYAKPIPVDLLIDIFSRVPAKSIARFRCVSKFWEYILGRPDFTELYLTKSVPRLLFVAQVDKKSLVFSSPNPQNPKHNSSFVATRYKNFPEYFPSLIRFSRPVCGLVFSQNHERKARVICNPATGESITLPKVKATGIGKSYLGFDPISKQFKVLCMTWSRYGTPNTHRVLTLKTGKRLWRMIQDPVLPHFSLCFGICINGILYYQAHFERSNKADSESSRKIVCFDFRFEKFSIINMDEDMQLPEGQRNLFNNKGKLGVYERTWYKEVVLWVLEDAEKHIWSKRICLLPNNVSKYKIVGMTATGEILFSPPGGSKPFYMFYYNIESNTLTRVNIKGIEEFKDCPIYIPYIFLDYVENMIKFL